MAAKRKLKAVEAPKIIRLDLGCGKNKRKDGEWIGVDRLMLDGVDQSCDLTKTPWKMCPSDAEGSAFFSYEDNAVDEVNCSHFIEHLTAPQRIAFVNELYRVMKPGAKATIVVPHWASCRAYGDLTHQWPPVSEMWFYYLSKAWRAAEVPHTDIAHNPEGYSCDFEAVWGYGMHPSIQARAPDYQQFAMANYKEAINDIHATLTKK